MAGDRFLADKADAWDAVVQALNYARPQWHNLAGRGVDAAVAAIRELGAAREARDTIATAPIPPTSNEQGPLWTPTFVVERLLRQTQLSTADQITMDRKQLEGLLFDVLRCRNNHSAAGSVPETTTSHIDAFLAMALPRIGDLMQADPEDASPEGRELMLLADLADRYERQKYPEFAGRPVKPHRSGGGGPPAPEAPIEVLPRQVKTNGDAP